MNKPITIFRLLVIIILGVLFLIYRNSFYVQNYSSSENRILIASPTKYQNKCENIYVSPNDLVGSWIQESGYQIPGFFVPIKIEIKSDSILLSNHLEQQIQGKWKFDSKNMILEINLNDDSFKQTMQYLKYPVQTDGKKSIILFKVRANSDMSEPKCILFFKIAHFGYTSLRDIPL